MNNVNAGASQAVILAAGRGTRMGRLTGDRPKCMLEIAGRTLLEYKLDALPEGVEEVIVVVSYLGSVIHDRFGGDYRGKRLLYVEQDSPTGGTADALQEARGLLKDRFYVMNGDNIYDPKSFADCLPHEWAIVVRKSGQVRTGSVTVDKHMRVLALRENTDHAGGEGWANTGLYLLDTRIFDYPPVPKAPGSPELGLPQTIAKAAKDIRIQAVPADLWIEIKAPEDLEAAERRLGQ